MAAVKLSTVTTFTIFLTILLLSSRIQCQEAVDDEDCLEGLSDILDPEFVEDISDNWKQINDIGKQIISTAKEAKNGMSDSTTKLQGLYKELLSPVGDIMNQLVEGFTSINIAGQSRLFDALPPQISKPLRDPVGDVFNKVDDISYGITGITQAMGKGDQAGVTKNAKDTVNGVTGLNENLIGLFGSFRDLASSGLFQNFANSG